MNWLAYRYLAGVALAAVAVFGLVCRAMPSLLRKSRSRTSVELLVLTLVVALGLVTIYYRFYRGSLSFAYLDVGNDTSEQYVPYYCNMLDAIRSGTFDLWNHEYGLGVSFMSYQSWTLDPFNLLFVPLGLVLGNERVALALVIVQSIKVLIVALLADHLLTFYCETPLARILGSVLCAFSGYLMLWGQHYWLGTVFVLATLLPLLLELLMERLTPLRFLMLAVGVALSIMASVYSGFMVMLFATAYALLRAAHVSEGGVGNYLRLFGRLTIPVICGIIISMCAVIPYATLMLGESTRVVGAENGSALSRAITYLGTFVPLHWIPMILSRAMGNGLVSYGNPIPESVMPPTPGFSYVNVYEIITLGLSCGVFMLLSQFATWVVRDADRRTKVLSCLAGLLVVAYCLNFFLPAFSNALVAPKYRSSFAVVIPTCIAMAVGFDRRVVPGKVARIPLAVATVLSVGVIGWSLAHTVDGRLGCLWYLIATCASAAALWRLGDSPVPDLSMSKHASASDRTVANDSGMPFAGASGLVYALCCLAIVSSSIVDGFLSTNSRSVCQPSNMPSSLQSAKDADTVAALDWLRDYDPTFWRAEKLYSDWTSLNDSLVQHYRGVSSYNSTLDADVEEFYQQLWPEALVGDVAYQAFVSDPAEPTLLHALGVKYLLSREPLSWDWCRELTTVGAVHVYRNMRADSILTLTSGIIGEGEMAQMDVASRREMVGNLIVVPDDHLDVISYENPSDVTMEDLPALDLSWMPLEEWEMGENGLPAAVPASQARVSQKDKTSISGKVFANINSFACLAVPHVAGWTVRVDGEVVETTRADYGFIGFAVPAGVHDVEATYTAPHLGLGVACSLVGVALTLAGCVVIARLNRQ